MDLNPKQDSKLALYGLNLSEAETLVYELGFPKYRAAQLIDWLYKKHVTSFAEIRNLPRELLDALQKKYALSALQLETVQGTGDGESRKFLFKTQDGHFLESVLILQDDRRTVCLSTQLGCKIGCIFCASGKGKFDRNLTAGEIVEQAAWIAHEIRAPITNIVFMGMGEPLDNFEATMKSLEILMAPWGFELGARRITVSTSGLTPKIVEFVKRHEGRVRLSVSLHSADEALRTKLVPINKRYPIKELRQTLAKIHRDLKRDITFEYTLIAGINDSSTEARAVAKLAAPLHAKVNVIPYNPIREMDFKTPSENAVETFCGILRQRGIRVTVRQTAGRGIHAACGQLRLDRGKEEAAK